MNFEPPYPRKGSRIFTRFTMVRIRREVTAMRKMNYMKCSFYPFMRKGTYIGVPSSVWRQTRNSV